MKAQDLKVGHVYTEAGEDLPFLVIGKLTRKRDFCVGAHVYELSDAPCHTRICHTAEFKDLGRPALDTRIGGTTVVVWGGYLYTGCTRHNPAQADNLVAEVASALGWGIER